MSHVTNIILCHNITEERNENREYLLMQQINQWIKKRRSHEEFIEIHGMEAVAYYGDFKNLNLREFIKKIISLNWKNKEYVQLFIKDECDRKFHLLEPFNKESLIEFRERYCWFDDESDEMFGKIDEEENKEPQWEKVVNVYCPLSGCDYNEEFDMEYEGYIPTLCPSDHSILKIHIKERIVK